VRHGLVGYGLGGRRFHAPYLVAADGIDLGGVADASPERRAQVLADFPGMPVYESLGDLVASGVDSVTITTPPHTRRELVLAAIGAGVRGVVADKPFAPTAAAGRDLADAAESAGVTLSIFHNRRYDADYRTLAAVVKGDALGDLWRVESRFDLDEPGRIDPGPFGGLLRDLGVHLIDQLLTLLGPARTVHAHLDWVEDEGGRTDAGFTVDVIHSSGVRSSMSASKLNRNHERELRAYGSNGSYISHSSDVQAASIFAGLRPAAMGSRWGYEPEDHWGTLRTPLGARRVPSERGAYQDFYTEFAAAVRGDGENPVPPEQAIRNIAVLDAARASALEGRIITFDDPL